jgi:hypothetical protein
MATTTKPQNPNTVFEKIIDANGSPLANLKVAAFPVF